MKKIALLLIGIVALVSSSKAQSEVEIMPFMGYTFGDKFYAGRIGDGMSWGAVVAYPIKSILSVELTYSGQKGESKIYGNGITGDTRMDLTSSYVLLGVSKNIPVSQVVTLFGGWGAGVGIYSPELDRYDSSTKFAMNFKAGAKFFLTDRFGLFVQANFNFPITGVDADVWWTIGGGPDAGLSTRTPFTQFGFNGGLVFKIGGKSSAPSYDRPTTAGPNRSARK